MLLITFYFSIEISDEPLTFFLLCYPFNNKLADRWQLITFVNSFLTNMKAMLLLLFWLDIINQTLFVDFSIFSILLY